MSAEKQEFEETRKELENRLKDIKREVEQMMNPHANQI